MSQHRVVCVVGTRPEAVKMAPVILRLRRPDSEFRVVVLSTGQHRDLLDGALADFGIKADEDLDLMRPGQDLAGLTARALVALDGWLDRQRPDLVMAQGDTTTVFCTAMACHYQQVPFAHVEAGLRSGDPRSPFPEEINRILTSRLASLHFAPTPAARDNLLREGVAPDRVFEVGNTVIDALLWIARRNGPMPESVPAGVDRFVLLTVHRRENLGEPLARVCRAVRALVDRHEDLHVVFPVHPNPVVREVVARELSGVDRVHRIEPVGYACFVTLMNRATLILTDSGGVQEEAPALGRPVLVLRDRTERPEAVALGASRLVGTDPDRIIAAATPYLSEPPPRNPAVRPYGDGHAADRIARVLTELGTRPRSWRIGPSPGMLDETGSMPDPSTLARSVDACL